MLRYGHLPLIGLAILLLGAAIFTAIADRTVALKLVQEAESARQQGRFADAERLSQEALKYARSQYGEQSARVAEVLELRGAMFADEHKFADSETELVKARLLREQINGIDSPEYGHICEVLGAFYTDREKYPEAEACLQRALLIADAERKKPAKKSEDVIANVAEAIRGPQDPPEAQVRSELAWLYTKQGEYSRSEQLYKQAMAIRERVLSANHPAIRKNAEDLKLLDTMQKKY